MAASAVAEWPRLFNAEEMFLSLSWKSLQSMEEEIWKDGSYMERPGKRSSNRYLNKQNTNASQKAGGKERGKG